MEKEEIWSLHWNMFVAASMDFSKQSLPSFVLRWLRMRLGGTMLLVSGSTYF